MTRQRLARLEKAVREFGGRPCSLCWGQPVAAVREEVESDPHGPGFRRTGRTLEESSSVRITNDLRCRRCGAAARVVLLMQIKEIDQEQEEHV